MIVRRRPGWFALAATLLALLLQALSPGEAEQMAAARLDPLADVVICAVGGHGPRHPTGRRDPADGCGACLICGAAMQVATLTPQPDLPLPRLVHGADPPRLAPAPVADAVPITPKARGPPGPLLT
ncbi:MAG: DUF2946 family protein [Caulobacteraceae bacterium]|nr:DUF2946 family protein [Caulobacteraceae bacterium]